MPAAWKTTKLRGLSRFLSSDHRSKPKAGSGDEALLPDARAAFFDHHADVAPRKGSRPRKPPRWLSVPICPEGGAMFPTMAALASEIITTTHPLTPPARLPPAFPPPYTAGGEQQHQQKQAPVAQLEQPERDAASEGGLRCPPAPSPTTSGAWSVQTPPHAAAQGTESPIEEDLGCLIGKEVPGKEDGPEFGASTAAEAPGKEVTEEGGSNRWLLVLATVLLPVFVFVIVTKKVALGVSILAFAALFMGAMGKRLIPLIKPCKDAEKSMDGAAEEDVQVSDLIHLPDGSDSTSTEQIPIILSEIDETDSGSERSWALKASRRGAASTGA